MSSVQLDDLPTEIFEQITQYLSLKECCRLERVNSEWRNAMRKEWRRLKIVNFDDPFFSGILETIINYKSNDSACVDPGTVCLQELAVKIHNYVQSIKVANKHVVAFLQKLSELSTPKLRELTFERDYRNFNESDAKTMTDVAQSIPLTLESLQLRFLTDERKQLKYFCDGFSQRTFTQLKSLRIHHSGAGDSSFRMNALQTPNLKELALVVDWYTNEKIFDIDNLDQLTDLETLEYNSFDRSTAESSFSKTLETATRKDCKFLQTLKTLDLDGYCTDEQLLSQIGRFSALERLWLPPLQEIDTAGQLRILRSIGRRCANLKSLCLEEKVKDEVIIEVADCFHNLRLLQISDSGMQQIASFVNRLSVDRCMEIRAYDPPEAEVQASGILNSHPNIQYRNIV